MKTKQWINNARLTTWWLDFADLGWPDRSLTAKWEQRAQYFREKGVNGVVLSGFHFRWDYHPLFERVFGLLGEIATICHQQELKVIEQHSATRVHQVRNEEDRRRTREQCRPHVSFYPDNWEDAVYRGEKLADWRQVSARQGEPGFAEERSSHSFCPNHPGYQRSYLDYLKRHLAAVPIDGLICDDVQFLPDVYSCACSHCQKRFLDETGVHLPPTNDRLFWENRDNPDFLAWLRARYEWQADHYKRLRAELPKEVLLMATAFSCIDPGLVRVGVSPQLFTEPCDVVLHQIAPGTSLGADHTEVVSEIAGFTSLARNQKKPLLTQCHVERIEDLGAWLNFLVQHEARPWIARDPRRADSVSEEQLLEQGYTMEKARRKKSTESVQAIAFSETFRDSLDPSEAIIYVETYRQLSADLLSRGSEPLLLLDNMWTSASPDQWECLWILDARSLSAAQGDIMEEWQEKGLAVGIS